MIQQGLFLFRLARFLVQEKKDAPGTQLSNALPTPNAGVEPFVPNHLRDNLSSGT